MSVLGDVLRELEAGADTATVARHLGISPDLAAAAIDHWVDAGLAVRPERTTGLPARPEPGGESATSGQITAMPARPARPDGAGGTGPASGTACGGCEPRPRWRTALSCHGCPFAAPR